jgi:hypothetical protein
VAVADLDAALGIYGAAIEATTGVAWPTCPEPARPADRCRAARFTNATLRPGIEVVAEMAGLATRLRMRTRGLGEVATSRPSREGGHGRRAPRRQARHPGGAAVRTLGPGSEALAVSGLFSSSSR